MFLFVYFGPVIEMEKEQQISCENLNTIPLIWPFEEGPFHYVFMVRLLCLMKSGEVCNLLGFHTNSFVEEALLKKSLRSGSLWARQTDKGWGRQVRGGVQDEREAGHNAKCRQGGATGSPGHFNLWIHCFPLCHWSLISCNEACWSQ